MKFLLFYIYLFIVRMYVNICSHTCIHYGIHVDVRGQPNRISSLEFSPSTMWLPKIKLISGLITSTLAQP